jgi:hypothetical protein
VLVRISTAFAFLAVLVIVAGCGGGGSSSAETSSGSPQESGELTKAAFIEEADALCSAYQDQTEPIRDEIEGIEKSSNPESPKNVVRLGELLGEAVATAEGELESIRELEPPQADASTLETMLDTAQEGNGSAAEYGEALEEGETSRFGDLGKETEAANNRAKGMAEGYGLKVCGQAP